MERETGIEPATNSLEGCDSTTELLPLIRLYSSSGCPVRGKARTLVGAEAFFRVMTDFPIANALLYTGAGIVTFAVAFAILARLAPFDVWREIRQERNVAAAILAGAVALGLCWIIAAAMH